MCNKKASRIPAAIDQGRHRESTMSCLWQDWQSYKELIAKGEDLITDTGATYACGLPVPEFQRDLCWSQSQEILFIESAWLGMPLGTYTVHKMDWHSNGRATKYSGWLLDGQQRLTAIQHYWEDKFPVFGLHYSELTQVEKYRFERIKFTHYEPELWDESLIKELYNRMALGGVAHKETDRA
tara:strand:- start:2682 stop:3227 length:546 start_codon:yes stop_codon:yes gene_type:complete